MADLSGRRILVVEDELLIATVTAHALEDHGATVVGPYETLAEALAAAQSPDIDAAVLDVNLRGETIDPVAELLLARGVPVILVTGYLESGWSKRPGVIVMGKPYDPEDVVVALTGLLSQP